MEGKRERGGRTERKDREGREGFILQGSEAIKSRRFDQFLNIGVSEPTPLHIMKQTWRE